MRTLFCSFINIIKGRLFWLCLKIPHAWIKWELKILLYLSEAVLAHVTLLLFFCLLLAVSSINKMLSCEPLHIICLVIDIFVLGVVHVYMPIIIWFMYFQKFFLKNLDAAQRNIISKYFFLLMPFFSKKLIFILRLFIKNIYK